MAKTTKAQSGLTITRKKQVFTLSWKLGEQYTSQKLYYCIANSFDKNGKPNYPEKKGKDVYTKAPAKKIGAKTTSFKLPDTNTLAAVKFYLEAKAEDKTAKKTSVKSFVVQAPSKPSVGVSVVNDYTSTFSWSAPDDPSSSRPFVENLCHTQLTINKSSNDSKWDNIGTGKSGAESSWTCEEVGWNTINNSYRRWVRIRSKGWKSLYSPYSYASHIYATPNKATDVKASRNAFGNGYAVTVTWNSPENDTRPIDVINIEHGKVIPNVSVVYPEEDKGTVRMTLSCPSTGVNWTSVVDTGGRNGFRTASFIDNEGLADDNCQYIVIANKHDNNIARSSAIVPSGGYGKLVPPSIPVGEQSVTNPRLFTVSVNSRGTAITNAAIAVYFRLSSKQNDAKCIGIIPPGGTSTDCIIPTIPEGDTIAFGARTFVGDYTPRYAPSGSTSETIFKPDPKMASDIVWGQGVPLPPTITADPVNESTIRVTWNRSWSDATDAELSWSDHDDAWMSTSEPSTYVVSNINAGAWNIAGLSVGTYYVRVRLIKKEGDSNSYSGYSTIQTVKLSSSPDIPSLLLSSNVIPQTGTVTCYWAYVSGDGTGQKQAQIYEAFPEYEAISNPPQDANPYESGYYEKIGEKYVRSLDTELAQGKTYYQTTGVITYSTSEIARTESAQHIDLDVEKLNWLPGETHHVVVKVMSLSDEMSAGFSAPAHVTIADELHVEITASSLTTVSVPAEFEDDVVISYNDVFSLTALNSETPLTFTVDGFQLGNTITCIIERAEDYHVERPDESEYEGFKGETIVMKDFDTPNISITQDDLIGSFDDGGAYRVTMILNDAYGQSVDTSRIPMGTYSTVTIPENLFVALDNPIGSPKDNKYYILQNDVYVLSTDTEVVPGTTYYVKDTSINPIEKEYYVLVNNQYVLTTDTEIDPSVTYYTKDYAPDDIFEVHWMHQAVMPSATIELDREHNITKITPVQPESGYENGDLVDIYRLSADPPELIFAGATFGTTYVDPYPAYGDFGGIRVVYRTLNGDYITALNQLAITDYAADENPAYRHNRFGIIIDFGSDQMVLPGNVSFSNKWNKDFSLTKYLGGSIQGDWNPAVERKMTAKATVPVELETSNIEDLRRLSIYSGICHVRTSDGSSFAANIDVNDDREEKWTTQLAKISLDITKCDSEGYDGLAYADWQSQQDN